jgi:diacylglycerol kinase
MKRHPLSRRLGWALAGWREAWRSEGSFRTQVVFVTLGLIVFAIVRPAPIWWALAVLTGALSIGFELFNSSLERLADRLHPDQHPDIGATKDMAAGAVLALALAGAVIAVLAVLSTL